MSEVKHIATIVEENGKYRYFDKDGIELKNGDIIRYESGREEKLYLTADSRLGTDATNSSWIESGRAVPCEYGIYPLEYEEMKEISRVGQLKNTTQPDLMIRKECQGNSSSRLAFTLPQSSHTSIVA